MPFPVQEKEQSVEKKLTPKKLIKKVNRKLVVIIFTITSALGIFFVVRYWDTILGNHPKPNHDAPEEPPTIPIEGITETDQTSPTKTDQDSESQNGQNNTNPPGSNNHSAKVNFSAEDLANQRKGYLPNVVAQSNQPIPFPPQLIIKEEEGLQAKIEQELKNFFDNPESYGPIDSDTKRKILKKLKGGQTIEELIDAFKHLKMKRIEVSTSDLSNLYNQIPFTKQELLEALEKDDLVAIEEKKGFEYPDYSAEYGKKLQYSTNFSNAMIGGDWTKTFAQEEALMLLSLFIIMKQHLSTYHNGKLRTNEIAIIEELPLFGTFDAAQVYSERGSVRIEKMLNILKPLAIYKVIHLLCLDAPHSPRIYTHQEYSVQELIHLMSKLFISGIAMIESNPTKETVMIEFGNWGGGAFKNNLIVVYALTFIMIATLNARYKGKGMPKLTIRLHPMDMGMDKVDKALELVIESLNKMDIQSFTIADLWNVIKQLAEEKQNEVLASEDYQHLQSTIEALKQQGKHQEAAAKTVELKKKEYSFKTAEQCSHGV